MREPVHIGEPIDESAIRQRFRNVAHWLAKTEYDPDKGTRAADFQVSAHALARRFAVSESDDFKINVPGVGDDIRPREVSGVILEPVADRKRWRPVSIESRADLKEFNESERGRHKRFIEQWGLDSDFGSGNSMDNTSLIDRDEFVPLMGGPFYKQLYIYDYLLMHSRAFQLVNHNALAASAVKQLTRFVVGRGVSFHIRNDAARAVWEEFWNRNNMRARVRQMARDLTWQGELLLRYYEKQRGYATLRVLDASSCWEIVTDVEDIDHVYYYHFQYPTPYQIYGVGQIPVTKYIIQQIPPTNIQHLKINVSSQEKRGRSDLLPSMPWLKRFDDFYNGITLKQVLEANLVWKITVEGDQADVDAILASQDLQQLPPPGGVWLQNSAVNLEPVNATMTSSRGGSDVGSEIASIVATSLNLPREYFNIGGPGAARATALVRTDPAVKTIEDRQQLMRETLEEMYDRVLSMAITAKRLDPSAAREEPDVTSGDDNDDDERDDEQEQPIRSRRVPVR